VWAALVLGAGCWVLGAGSWVINSLLLLPPPYPSSLHPRPSLRSSFLPAIQPSSPCRPSSPSVHPSIHPSIHRGCKLCGASQCFGADRRARTTTPPTLRRRGGRPKKPGTTEGTRTRGQTKNQPQPAKFIYPQPRKTHTNPPTPPNLLSTSRLPPSSTNFAHNQSPISRPLLICSPSNHLPDRAVLFCLIPRPIR
jgi:hypothetical protein